MMTVSALAALLLLGSPVQVPLVSPAPQPRKEPAPAARPAPVAPPLAPAVAAPPVEAAPAPVAAAPAAAVEPEPASVGEAGAPSEDLAFGDHLFDDGDYYRAVTEYRRYLFRTRGKGTDSPRVALAIGEAYLRGAQYEAAALQFESVADRRTDALGNAVANLGAARAYLLDDRPLLARPRVRRLFQNAEAEPVLRSEAALLLGISYLQAENFPKARSIFEDPKLSTGPRSPLAKALVNAIVQRERLPQKNPLLAFLLALVPGLGHFYLGQFAVGLTAAMWNGLFMLGALDAWVQRSWGVAIILTLLELTFYGGSIFGSVSGAFKYNRDQELNWKDSVRAQYEAILKLPDPTLGTQPGALLRFGVPLDVPVP
jgi:TM2 domain-containing membrane protein YozV